MKSLNYTPISISDIFKVGIGPSSSHTMGPWRAALDFIGRLSQRGLAQKVVSIKVELMGSLCKTGKGHGTDMGVQMGLCGELPDEIDPQKIPQKMLVISEQKKLSIPYLINGDKDGDTPYRDTSSTVTVNNASGYHSINFDPKKDIVFMWDHRKSDFLKSPDEKLLHPNTLFCIAELDDGECFYLGYHSVGGGFIEGRGEGLSPVSEKKDFPYPIESPSDIIDYHKKYGLGFDEMVCANELSWKSEGDLDAFIKKIRHVMIASIYRGCHTEGVLSGGLNVSRRASTIYQNMMKALSDPLKHPPAYDEEVSEESINAWIDYIGSIGHRNFDQVINWVTTFALAVNEENASFGKIVTAPTNGAAGVIPAVLLYYICFGKDDEVSFAEIKKFLLVASEIGSLFKKGSTISAAAGGCQAEIGVSSSMAAAALTAVKGGDLAQILMAAEIAMEHHLGLTCDPIKGLVQVPCIERNTMGAIKAITASQLALVSDSSKSVVKLQDVIATMWSTAKDMNDKYKETSEGGLATNVSVNYAEC